MSGGDPDGIKHFAHRMQGTLRIFKNETIWKLLYELEELGGNGQLEGTQNAFAQTRPLMQQILGELASRVND